MTEEARHSGPRVVLVMALIVLSLGGVILWFALTQK